MIELGRRFLPYLAVLSASFPGSAVADVLTWQCDFDTRTTLEGVESEPFALEFRVDTSTGIAYMQGNVGLVSVEVFVGDEGFTFIQRVTSGTVQTTTIAASGEAVHSRNTLLLGEIVAGQHFGRCQLV